MPRACHDWSSSVGALPTLKEMTVFAQHLIHTIALPTIEEGFDEWVARLRNNPDLGRLVRKHGVDEVLAGDDPVIAELKKRNQELVTTAEKVAERRMAEAVVARYPAHDIVGEEHGYRRGSGERHFRWVFDPVDGTSAMVRAAFSIAYGRRAPAPTPAFGITLGVVSGDRAVAGVVAELCVHEETLQKGHTWVGAANAPTTCDGVPVEPATGVTSLAHTRLASTVPSVMFTNAEQWNGYQALQEATGAPAIIDQNCIGYMRLLDPISGIGVVYEADLGYHDVAALVPILVGAGLSVSDGHGKPLEFGEQYIDQEYTVVAALPGIRAAALERIRRGVAVEKSAFAGGQMLDSRIRPEVLMIRLDT